MSSEQRKRLSMSSKRRKKTSPETITESVSPQVEETPVVEETSCEKKEESGKRLSLTNKKSRKPKKVEESVEEQELPQPTELGLRQASHAFGVRYQPPADYVQKEEKTEAPKTTPPVRKKFSLGKKKSITESLETDKKIIDSHREEITKPQVEIKEEVIQTPQDRMMSDLDSQLSSMAKLTSSDKTEPKSLIEQKIELMEKQMTDLRRLMLETSQSTIVNGLGAGSPGSGEVNLLKLDDVKGDLFDKTSDGQLMFWDVNSQKFVSSAERGVDISDGISGYEFTGGFADRLSGSTGNLISDNVEYTSTQASSGTWRRFGFSSVRQAVNDVEYWGETNPYFDQSKGLFGGLHMPQGVTDLFDYDDTSHSAAVTTGDLQYTAANGSYNFKQCRVGDLAKVRFSFNVVPQQANTTLEVGLIWSTRDENDVVTFTFPLLSQPIFYGTGTVGKSFLNRVEMSAYFASNEDINARVLPAIRADNEILIQPLTTLCTIVR